MNFDKLRRLWDGHAKAVYTYLLHLTRSEADAKDILQDIFHRLAREPELVERLTDEPRGYLLRQARNAVIDQARRREVRERVFAKINALRQGEAADAEDPDNPLLQRALAAALRKLPEEQRLVVHARLWKKQTLDEIAAALGVSINTAASRYRYGLDKMREHLRSLYEDLIPRPAQPNHSTMKKRLPTPFQAAPEEPLIQPLEQRRVPSATGALLALPVLPAPEEHADESPAADLADHSGEVPVDFPEKPDLGDGEVIEGEVIPLPDFEELPITFDDVIMTFGGEKEVADPGAELPEGELTDVDVTWAVGEVFDGSDPGVFHVMNFGGIVADGETDHTLDDGSGEHLVDEIPGDKPLDDGTTTEDPSLAYTDYGPVMEGTHDGTTDGEVNHDGEPVIMTMTGSVHTSSAGTPTEVATGHVVDDHSMVERGHDATTGEVVDPALAYQNSVPVPTTVPGDSAVPTHDHADAPAAIHHEPAQHELTPPAAAASAAPVSLGESDSSHDTAHAFEVHHDTAPLAPIIDLHAASAHAADDHAPAEHEVLPLELGSVHHDFANAAIGHDSTALSVEDHLAGSGDATVDRWVPIEHFASDHSAAADHEHAVAGDLDADHQFDHPVVQPDAGVVSGSASDTLHGSSAAMASTGAVLLAGGPKIRGQKKRA